MRWASIARYVVHVAGKNLMRRSLVWIGRRPETVQMPSFGDFALGAAISNDQQGLLNAPRTFVGRAGRELAKSCHRRSKAPGVV
ncbi:MULTISPECIES: hypothetical protein [unclassified Phenylobacterium]|jgi:hypothetical protein|uniref:hypothetical protein n=1 Tax=unclassified Phenylobacterium TaxID=2640670 RepID=UPI0012E98F3C|nr:MULTISPECIES: hypothetical protein [unclassified Phenylobacterium]